TEIDLPSGTHELRVDLGIGRALVIVPPDIGLVMTGDVSIGELDLLGEDQAGIDNTLRSSNDVDDETTLLLDLEVGIGKGEVRSE
ncbi:MAG: cell wall-active antibiotics response protein, partial [Acidimicrobiia bacterium]|nr:cell wall-active antibiotics response protein [Acidimicrobiia bacterium]